VKKEHLFSILRIGMGWIFLWPFLDKLFGLGFTTTSDRSWLSGNSPTTGFLSGSHGPFGAIFQSMAGNVFVDWLFMGGLLLIGLALIFGIGMKIACYTGGLLLVMMWLATLPPEHNPFLDEHLIYALILFTLLKIDSTKYFGFSKEWSKNKIAKDYPFLK